MPLELIEECFSADDFAEPAVLNMPDGDAREINVIFDAEYTASQVGESTVQNQSPQVLCKTSDLESVTDQCTLEYNSITYYIRSVEHDGTGVSRLLLSKDPA